MPTTSIAALLHPWNPSIEAGTILLHLELLGESVGTADGARVWWPWINELGTSKALSAQESRSRWPWVAALHEDAKKAGKPFILLVTDFHMMHALQVEDVSYGSAVPEHGSGPVSAYTEGHQVGLWFKVTGVKAIASERIETLTSFGRLILAGSTQPYDPYRSFKYEYPIRVEWQGGGDQVSEGSFKSSARDHSICLPADLATATRFLSRKLGSSDFNALEKHTQVFLANAILQSRILARLPDWDHAPVIVSLSKAFESEWRAIALLLASTKIVTAADFEKSAGRDSPRPLDRFQWTTLGGMAFTLRRLGRSKNGDAQALENLYKAKMPRRSGRSPKWLEWVSDTFVPRRGAAAHSELVSREAAESLLRVVLHSEVLDGRSALSPLLSAKAALGALWREQSVPGEEP